MPLCGMAQLRCHGHHARAASTPASQWRRPRPQTADKQDASGPGRGQAGHSSPVPEPGPRVTSWVGWEGGGALAARGGVMALGDPGSSPEEEEGVGGGEDSELS